MLQFDPIQWLCLTGGGAVGGGASESRWSAAAGEQPLGVHLQFNWIILFAHDKHKAISGQPIADRREYK